MPFFDVFCPQPRRPRSKQDWVPPEFEETEGAEHLVRGLEILDGGGDPAGDGPAFAEEDEAREEFEWPEADDDT
jgi:hypothetical protein